MLESVSEPVCLSLCFCVCVSVLLRGFTVFMKEQDLFLIKTQRNVVAKAQCGYRLAFLSLCVCVCVCVSVRLCNSLVPQISQECVALLEFR